MRDDIQRMLADLGRTAEQAAAPVGFERIRQRAGQRRRVHAISAAVLCVAVAAGVGVTSQVGGSSPTIGPVHHGGRHPSPPPSPTVPTPSPTPRRTARQIVEDPRSFVVVSSVYPGDADQAATLWELGPAGRRAQFGLTTTFDGYRHVRYIDLAAPYGRDCTDVRAVGNHQFWLSCALGDVLVRSDGSVNVAKSGRARGPVPNGAVLFPAQSTGGGVSSNWIDAHEQLHDVSVPASANLVHAPDGRIWGLAYWTPKGTNRLLWSTDGGRSWSSRALPPLPTGRSDAYEVVPTAVPGQMVLARGVAETVFVPHSILMFGSTGQQLQRNHLDTVHAAMDSAVVTPHGSLVMELYNEPNGGSGLFRAPAENWADLHRVMDLPTDADGRPAGSLWMGNSLDPSGQPVVWAVFTSGELATSTDDGQTWTTRSLR